MNPFYTDETLRTWMMENCPSVPAMDKAEYRAFIDKLTAYALAKKARQ